MWYQFEGISDSQSLPPQAPGRDPWCLLLASSNGGEEKESRKDEFGKLRQSLELASTLLLTFAAGLGPANERKDSKCALKELWQSMSGRVSALPFLGYNPISLDTENPHTTQRIEWGPSDSLELELE